MALAVIDATGEGLHLDIVFEGWCRCDLVRPLAWGSLAEEGVAWRLLGMDGEGRTERGEVINALGGARASLRVVVVIDAPSDDAVAAAIDELGHLEAEFGADRGDGDPTKLDLTLLVLPVREDECWRLEIPPRLANRAGWRLCYAVSPEDGPAPRQGDELGERPLTSVAAQCLASLADAWTFEAGEPPVPSLPKNQPVSVRLVRVWTRVVDAGYVLDHVAAKLPDLPDFSDEPSLATRRRFEQAHARFAEDVDITADTRIAPIGTARRKDLTNWEYVRRFLAYYVLHTPSVLIRVVYGMTAALVKGWWERLGRWVAQVLRRPPSDDTPADDTVNLPRARTPVELARDRARETLKELEGPYDVKEPPAASPKVWRAVSGHVIDLIDEQLLSIDEAVDLVASGDRRSPLGELVAAYRGNRDAVLTRLTPLLGANRSETAEASANEEVAEPGWIRRVARFIRRRLVRMLTALILVVGGVALVLVNPLFGALVVAVGVVVLFAGGWSWRIAKQVTAILRDDFASSQKGNDPAALATEIDQLTAELVRFSYRIEQAGKWARAIAAVSRSVGQGVKLSEAQLGSFEPGNAPRSMSFATGTADDELVEHLAKGVRGSASPPLFRTLWNLVQADFPAVYNDVTRDTARGELARLALVHAEGLPDEVRSQERALIWGVVGNDPMACMSGVVPWTRQRSPRGLEMLVPVADGPLGPIERGGSTSKSQQDEAESALFGVIAAMADADGVLTGIGTRFPGGVLVTAATCAEHEATRAYLWTTTGPVRVAKVATMAGEDGMVATAGGNGLVQVGRRVVLAVAATGVPEPAMANIVRVGPEGDFEVDTPGLAGSPVLDIETRSVIGILTGEGTTAAGPIALRFALLDDAFTPAADDELDPGALVPLDVLMTSGAAPESQSTVKTAPKQTSPAKWLGEVGAELMQGFPPKLFRDGAYDDVDSGASLVRPLAVATDVTGRLLVASTAVQVSKPIPLRIFEQAALQMSVDDADDAQRGALDD